MPFFWVQTTIEMEDGGYAKFAVEAPHDDVKAFDDALVEDGLITCSRVWTQIGGNGARVIMRRETIGLGIGYVGMVQLCDPQPIERR
jgi:hypothetical protein